MNCKFTDKSNDMFFWNKICGLGFMFFLISISAGAQLSLQFSPTANIFSQTNKIVQADSSTRFSSTLPNLNSRIAAESIIPEDFSTCKYGFFCKKELVVEKAIKIPLRVRLGSLEQCNYYEVKR